MKVCRRLFCLCPSSVPFQSKHLTPSSMFANAISDDALLSPGFSGPRRAGVNLVDLRSGSARDSVRLHIGPPYALLSVAFNRSRALSSRCLPPLRVRKKGWTLARLLRGEQQATRVQPKALGPLTQRIHLPGLSDCNSARTQRSLCYILSPHASTMTSNPP